MAEEPAQTTVEMTIKGWKIEVSVNMGNVPLRVYEETKDDRQTVCWIASEVGKAYSVTMSAKRVGRLKDNSFDKIDAEVLIDGQQCRWVFLNDKPLTYSTTRIDATHVQEWLFTQPRLHEEVGPSQIKPNKDLGTIVIQLRRARSGGEDGVTYRYTALRGPDTISERTKKGVLGAVTTKPEDIINPLWTFRFNYATEAILQAQGRIALKHNIKRGEPGLIATAPIDLDDDEPGPSMRTFKGRKRLEGNKARTGLMAQEVELDAMEDDLSAELAKIRAKKRSCSWHPPSSPMSRTIPKPLSNDT